MWVDGRFNGSRPRPVRIWKGQREIRVEVVDARKVRFESPDLDVIAKTPGDGRRLNVFEVAEGHLGVGT